MTTTPLVRRLKETAVEFDLAYAYYVQLPGEHNALLRVESRRAATQLQKVAQLVERGEWSQQRGLDWLKAAWRILTAIGRNNIK
jgi:hypothetical protein